MKILYCLKSAACELLKCRPNWSMIRGSIIVPQRYILQGNGKFNSNKNNGFISKTLKKNISSVTQSIKRSTMKVDLNIHLQLINSFTNAQYYFNNICKIQNYSTSTNQLLISGGQKMSQSTIHTFKKHKCKHFVSHVIIGQLKMGSGYRSLKRICTPIKDYMIFSFFDIDRLKEKNLRAAVGLVNLTDFSWNKFDSCIKRNRENVYYLQKRYYQNKKWNAYNDIKTKPKQNTVSKRIYNNKQHSQMSEKQLNNIKMLFNKPEFNNDVKKSNSQYFHSNKDGDNLQTSTKFSNELNIKSMANHRKQLKFISQKPVKNNNINFKNQFRINNLDNKKTNMESRRVKSITKIFVDKIYNKINQKNKRKSCVLSNKNNNARKINYDDPKNVFEKFESLSNTVTNKIGKQSKNSSKTSDVYLRNTKNNEHTESKDSKMKKPKCSSDVSNTTSKTGVNKSENVDINRTIASSTELKSLTPNSTALTVVSEQIKNECVHLNSDNIKVKSHSNNKINSKNTLKEKNMDELTDVLANNNRVDLVLDNFLMYYFNPDEFVKNFQKESIELNMNTDCKKDLIANTHNTCNTVVYDKKINCRVNSELSQLSNVEKNGVLSVNFSPEVFSEKIDRECVEFNTLDDVMKTKKSLICSNPSLKQIIQLEQHVADENIKLSSLEYNHAGESVGLSFINEHIVTKERRGDSNNIELKFKNDVEKPVLLSSSDNYIINHRTNSDKTSLQKETKTHQPVNTTSTNDMISFDNGHSVQKNGYNKTQRESNNFKIHKLSSQEAYNEYFNTTFKNNTFDVTKTNHNNLLTKSTSFDDKNPTFNYFYNGSTIDSDHDRNFHKQNNPDITQIVLENPNNKSAFNNFTKDFNPETKLHTHKNNLNLQTVNKSSNALTSITMSTDQVVSTDIYCIKSNTIPRTTYNIMDKENTKINKTETNNELSNLIELSTKYVIDNKSENFNDHELYTFSKNNEIPKIIKVELNNDGKRSDQQNGKKNPHTKQVSQKNTYSNKQEESSNYTNYRREWIALVDKIWSLANGYHRTATVEHICQECSNDSGSLSDQYSENSSKTVDKENICNKESSNSLRNLDIESNQSHTLIFKIISPSVVTQFKSLNIPVYDTKRKVTNLESFVTNNSSPNNKEDGSSIANSKKCQTINASINNEKPKNCIKSVEPVSDYQEPCNTNVVPRGTKNDIISNFYLSLSNLCDYKKENGPAFFDNCNDNNINKNYSMQQNNKCKICCHEGTNNCSCSEKIFYIINEKGNELHENDCCNVDYNKNDNKEVKGLNMELQKSNICLKLHKTRSKEFYSKLKCADAYENSVFVNNMKIQRNRLNIANHDISQGDERIILCRRFSSLLQSLERYSKRYKERRFKEYFKNHNNVPKLNKSNMSNMYVNIHIRKEHKKRKDSNSIDRIFKCNSMQKFKPFIKTKHREGTFGKNNAYISKENNSIGLTKQPKTYIKISSKCNLLKQRSSSNIHDEYSNCSNKNEAKSRNNIFRNANSRFTFLDKLTGKCIQLNEGNHKRESAALINYTKLSFRLNNDKVDQSNISSNLMLNCEAPMNQQKGNFEEEIRRYQRQSTNLFTHFTGKIGYSDNYHKMITYNS